jgi:hypothetical protein
VLAALPSDSPNGRDQDRHLVSPLVQLARPNLTLVAASQLATMALCATLKPVTNHYIYAEWMGGVCQRVSVSLNNRLKSAEFTQLLERLQPTLYIGHADLYSGPRAVESSILPPESRFVVRGAREILACSRGRT